MSTLPIDEPQLLAAVLRYKESGSQRDAEIALKLADPLIHGMLGRAVTSYRLNPREVYCRAPESRPLFGV
jgi:hypothetical protein